jgi:hypothetical protein
LLTSSLGSRSNKISYLVSTRLNWNKQVCIITLQRRKKKKIASKIEQYPVDAPSPR